MQNKVVTTSRARSRSSARTSCASTFAASAHRPDATRRASASAPTHSPSSRGAEHRWPGLGALFLGGFSFGAAVALQVAAEAVPRGLVTVAPPLERLPADVRAARLPLAADPRHCRRRRACSSGPPRCARDSRSAAASGAMQGVGHFFHGRLLELERALPRFSAADFGAASEMLQGD